MATYQRQRYLFMTLDPVHIGTGGYRLGRVDNSIVREPGTKIPKIPGTSLHGAARSYAAQLYETPEAAGQNHDNIENPDENPVCYTFGYIKKSKNGNSDEGKIYSGVVNIFDAHVLLFPVHSMVGAVWVSTKERLEDAGFTVENLPNDWNNINTAVLNWQRSDALNLGWLMLQVFGQQAKITAPTKWKDEKRYQAINKIVLVKDALFSQIVNSNLEVRTSVAINPETGAAEEGALFTYEAIPRATFLTADVVLDDYRQAFPQVTKELHTGDIWNDSLDVVKAGFKLIEWLGVGGMGTRGFGRMAPIGEPIIESSGKEQDNE
ncbi:type III-B CRISPR module RAMP protein Cmr4 [Oscillatoria sp. FACHB-1406]|uniref:type III-B CRISPR module RAMP protein Cmr4 n=1 Tax=Oscillatoria sp. FACHB-1406 TaxID=2692846 RepID=UPI0016879AE6|nr:type III-B CRISPR module RAMP protein Cmr4 [Oscillatoria sp. FACHB-1406]MBD2578556.1 type III-B CRISPR module RAMP protein Cmr4 [Oscillatoria sp. FACHB-1406]